MKRPKRWPYEISHPLALVARQLRMTLDEYLAIAYREVDPPLGWDEVWAKVTRSLLSPEELSTLDTVNTTSVSSNALRSRARLAEGTRKSKAMRHLAKRGFTIAEVAVAVEKKLGRKVPRSTAQAWFKGKDDPLYRAIPQDAQQALAAVPFEIPPGAWPRVIPAP